MRVQRVLMPGSEAESWTVLGDDQVPVEPAERFLGYLASIGKSPNTAKAYAHDLKDWFTYLTLHGLDWRTVTVEDVAGFVAWLRLPPAGRDGKVAVLPTAGTYCSAASVNRKLAALTSFCEFHARHGVNLAGLLTTMQPAGRHGSSTSYKTFLQHVTKNGPQRRRTIGLKTPRARPKVLTAAEAQAILDACEHLRDRLLFAVLLDCGVRIGEALGLRHEDMGIAERAVTVMPRQNDNRARAKAGISRTIPASAELMRLYADYLTREYGSLDSDYVFVNLWSRPYGRPWTYAAVYDLVQRLRERTGIGFGPHQYRHTYATWLQGRGVASDATFGRSREHALPAAQRRPYGALSVPGHRRSRDDLGRHRPPGPAAPMLHLMPLRGMHPRCICCRHDASGAPWLHRMHRRRSRRAAPGRRSQLQGARCVSSSLPASRA
jgi:integrase/recombinase XerD